MSREYIDRTITTTLLLSLALLTEAIILILTPYKEIRYDLVSASTLMLMLFDLHSIGKRLRPRANLFVEETQSSTAIMTNGYKNIVTGGEYVAKQTLVRLTRRMR